ncbi:condensation domain-containing protein [Streptomyces sp. NPDC060035]|uniref:condensation domain-containing protein n=1 Tax=Streptomyces sp. NPDC060035 TaxID=3347044 RepID=UPI0036CC0CEC
MPLARTHPISVQGRSSRTYGLNRSQKWIWQMIESLAPDNRHMYLPVRIDIEDGSSVEIDDVTAGLHDLIARHEALRTTYARGERGEQLQMVHGDAEVAARVFEAGTQDVEDVCTQVVEEMRALPFLLDLPVRVSLVTRAGRPRILLLQVSHLSADAWALRLIEQQLRYTLSADSRAVQDSDGGRTSWQPVDQAQHEQGEAGARRAARALTRWRQQLDRFPATSFPERHGSEPENPRFAEARMDSAALAAAALALADRHSATASSVLMAAVLTLLAERSGNGSAGVYTLVANRLTDDLRDMVGTAVQYAPVSVETAGRTFPETVRATWSAMMQSQRSAQYDLDQVEALVREVTEDRQGELDVACTINLLNEFDPTAEVAAGPPPSVSEVNELARHTRFSWDRGMQQENLKFYMSVRVSPERIALFARGDSTVLPSSEMRDLMLGIETLLLEAMAE